MFMGRFALALLAAMILAPAASAQNFPTRPMTIVMPFGVGSALDLIARIIGSRMAEVLGQPVLVENVSGGMTAAARVFKRPTGNVSRRRIILMDRSLCGVSCPRD